MFARPTVILSLTPDQLGAALAQQREPSTDNTGGYDHAKAELRHLRGFHALYGEYLATEPGTPDARIAWNRLASKHRTIAEDFPYDEDDL